MEERNKGREAYEYHQAEFTPRREPHRIGPWFSLGSGTSSKIHLNETLPNLTKTISNKKEWNCLVEITTRICLIPRAHVMLLATTPTVLLSGLPKALSFHSFIFEQIMFSRKRVVKHRNCVFVSNKQREEQIETK